MSVCCILGGGGHGQDVAEIARALGGGPVLFDDKNAEPFTLAGYDTHWPAHRYVLGVNNPALKRKLRRKLKLAATLVHPDASVAADASIAPGVVVGAGTHIGPHSRLGSHVHVGAGCTITRTKVGDFTTISPGVDIAGDVRIGEECLIGVGAVVSNLVTIGDRCVIGAGAVVVHDVPDDTTVAGVPARPLQRKEVSA